MKSALLGDKGDEFDTGDMHGVEIEVPKEVRLVFITKWRKARILCFVVTSNKVVHDIQVCDLSFIPHIPLLQNPRE